MKKLIIITAILAAPFAWGQTLTNENGQNYLNFAPAVSWSSDAGTLVIKKLRVELIPPVAEGDLYKANLSHEYNIQRGDKKNHASFNGFLIIQLQLDEKPYGPDEPAKNIQAKVLAAFMAKFQALASAPFRN